MSAFSREETRRFLAGDWVECTSSNVREAKYAAAEEVLYLGFGRPGDPVSYYGYPNVWPELAELFALATSKGKWVHQYLKQTGWEYYKLL